MSEESPELEPMWTCCDTCNNDYEIHNQKDAMRLFLVDWPCNHIEAICPHCGAEEAILIEPEVVIHVLRRTRLALKLSVSAPAHIQALVDLRNEEPPDASEVNPLYDGEPPHWMLRELYDQLRDYEKDN